MATVKCDDSPIASAIVAATSFGSRLFGLMGKKRIGPEEGLWLPKCRAVHTWFMRAPIDIVFVDAGMRVQKVLPEVAPWRVTLSPGAAAHVLELAPGRARTAGVAAGSQLSIHF